MRHARTMLAVTAVALLGLAVGKAAAAEALQSLVKKVDAKMYYPQQRAMRSLQADVQSSQLEEQIKNSPEAKNVKLLYYWSAPYKQRFVLSGVPDSMSEQADRFERQLAMWGERLVPKPLELTLADYKCTVGENEKSFTIDAQATSPSARIESMKYTIDKKTLLPTLWNIGTGSWSADVEIKYEEVPGGGLSIPIEMKAKADQNDITLKLTYKMVEKWYLPESLTVSFAGSDGSQRTSILRLSNYKINQPLPADVFPAQK
jgi:hypothetical protein